MGNEERIPVIVGVGDVSDRPENADEGLDSRGLMRVALERADNDAGGGWLKDLGSLAVVDQISWPHLGDIGAALAAEIGAEPKVIYKSHHASGDSPILLLNEAANMIGEGKIHIAAVVGGEALRTAAHFARKADPADPLRGNAISKLSDARVPPYRRRYGLNAPVDVYPLYENAGRAAYGQTLKQGQSETGQIWSLFAGVAEQTEGAWIRRGASAEEILTQSPTNRPIAHPYNKFMVANSSVNQGAGFIVTSLAEAKRRGVAPDRLVHIGLGASAHENEDPLLRDGYQGSASMEASITEALRRNDLSVDDLDFVELYSCFPCVPKMARRVLGWPSDRPATVFGGLTFGGGPIGNYMAHAVVNMVRKLRKEGDIGLLYANGGFATHNHTIVLSAKHREQAIFPQVFDVQERADAARGPIPVVDESYAGPAVMETFTVLYDRDGQPRHGIVVARTPAGARTLAKVPAEDVAGIEVLTKGEHEPIGTWGEIVRSLDGDHHWRAGSN